VSPGDQQGEEPDRPGPGHVRPTSQAALAAFGVVGLVSGWLLRLVVDRLGGNPPVVTWLQVGVLAFVAGAVLVTAFVTWRALQVRREWIEPHRAVNRLMMAKSCALVGALVAGGYAGHAVSWLGLEAELAGQRVVRSLLAAAAALTMMYAALWLERACRTSGDEDDA
jgi:hypothetical protein